MLWEMRSGGGKTAATAYMDLTHDNLMTYAATVQSNFLSLTTYGHEGVKVVESPTLCGRVEKELHQLSSVSFLV